MSCCSTVAGIILGATMAIVAIGACAVEFVLGLLMTLIA